MCPSRSRRSAFGLLLSGAAVFASLSAAAAAGASAQGVGVWDLKQGDGSRECRLMLREDKVASGYGLGVPPGCYRAFPFLVGAKTWIDTGGGSLRLDDEKAQPLLIFEPGLDGLPSARGPQGETLRLFPVGKHAGLVLKGPGEAEAPAPKPQAAKPAPPPVAAPAPKPRVPTVAEMAGHYAVLRKLGKDTGCMVTFDDKSRGPAGSFKANLAPACRDQGIMIFDPVGWQIEAGRLVLTARKGHTTKLDLQGDGSWAKDAKEGIGLSLKKM